jgi:ubiquitin-small subunit ribosomal protein S27Ae
MAAPTGGSGKSKGEGKKPHKNKPTSKKWEHYKIEGSNVKREKYCPRCGPGIFLANHKDRYSCGKCKYTEFVGKAK